MRITACQRFCSAAALLCAAVLPPGVVNAADHADMDAVRQWVTNNGIPTPISDMHYDQRKQRMLVIDEAVAALSDNDWEAYKATWKHLDSQWNWVPEDEAGKLYYESTYPILHYLRQAEIDVIEEIENTQVTQGVVVWKMYNMGVIAKTPTKTFGMDVHQSDPDAFADLLDFLIVSHSHPDHFDKAVAQAMKQAGKPVYGPQPVGVATVKVPAHNIPFDETGQNGWKWGDVFEYSEGDIDLRFVTSYQGVNYSNSPYGKKEPNLVVRITCTDADDYTIIHSGDGQQSTHAETARDSAPIDLFVCHAGLNPMWPMNKVKADLTVLGHANELGHGNRKTYAEIYAERLEETGLDPDGDPIAPKFFPRPKTTVATWGDRIDPQGYFAISAYRKIEAEAFDAAHNLAVHEMGSPHYLKNIHDESHVGYDHVQFGVGATRFHARIATLNAGGTIELRLDAPDGTLIGESDPLDSTGGWTDWTTIDFAVNPVLARGGHRLYLVFRKSDGLGICNVDWFRFERDPQIQAEHYDAAAGIDIDAAGFIENIHDGDYIGYDQVDLGPGVNLVEARIATPNTGGSVQLRLDTLQEVTIGQQTEPIGTVIGEHTLDPTGGWTNWATVSLPVDDQLAQGSRGLFLLFNKSNGQGICNVDWIRVSRKIEAEAFAGYFGISVDPQNQFIQNINNGEHVYYSDVNLGDGPHKIGVRAASMNSGTIEIRLDSVTGTLIGTVDIGSTGGWTNWEETAAVLEPCSGVHDLYFVFVGSPDIGLFNIDLFKLYP